MWSQFTISRLLTYRLLKHLRLGPKCLRLLIAWFSRVKSQTAPAHSWSIDFSSSEATLIPWSVPKKGFDCLIKFDPGRKHFYMGYISDYPLTVQAVLQFSVSYLDMCEQFLCVSIFFNYLQYSLFSQRWHVVLPPESLFRFHKQITEKSTATVEEQSEAVQEFYMVSVHQRWMSVWSSISPLSPLLPLLPPLLPLPPPVNGWAVEDASPLQDHDWWATRRHDGRYWETSHDKHLPKVWHQTTHH